jgi:hypothetical protein
MKDTKATDTPRYMQQLHSERSGTIRILSNWTNSIHMLSTIYIYIYKEVQLKSELRHTLESDRPQNDRWLISDELEMTGKVVVVANQVLSQHLAGRIKENLG